MVDAARGWKLPEAVGLVWLLVGRKRALDVLPTLRIPASRVEDAVEENSKDEVALSESL